MRLGNFSFTPGLVPTLATLAILPVLVTLGVWQLGRAEEKRNMEAMYQQRVNDEPLAIDEQQWQRMQAGETTADLAYRRVELHGRFDGERQFLLDNRTRNGVVGFHVLTSFVPDGVTGGLIVNRGWVPLGSSRSVLPALPSPDDSVRLTGSIDIKRTPLPLLGASGYEQQGWPKVVQRIDFEKMAEGLGYPLLPVVVLLDESAPAGFVREWKPYYGIPESRHLGYAVQWFALALTLVIIFIVVNTRRVRHE